MVQIFSVRICSIIFSTLYLYIKEAILSVQVYGKILGIPLHRYTTLTRHLLYNM